MSQTVDIRELNERIESKSSFVNMITMGMDQVIVGQKHLVESLMIGLLSDGHILLEGVPGLAKTLAIKTLASLIDAKYSRIQFTPDLLPADVIGTMIYSQKSEEFQVKQGPVFANFVLADEINRAPAKVQSALLEAMQERQVTISENTYKLPEPFLVMATQNPIEQEGTYPLPEAQVDRFMLKVIINYPKKEEEKKEDSPSENASENSQHDDASPTQSDADTSQEWKEETEDEQEESDNSEDVYNEIESGTTTPSQATESDNEQEAASSQSSDDETTEGTAEEESEKPSGEQASEESTDDDQPYRSPTYREAILTDGILVDDIFKAIDQLAETGECDLGTIIYHCESMRYAG